MEISQRILDDLRTKGHRITVARKTILEILENQERPLSAAEIHALLVKRKINSDRVTVYRELEFLKKEGIITCVQFQDRNRRYELAAVTHHHHLVCQKCDSVEDVKLSEDFEAQEERIAKQKKFKVLRHSLEFFGLCQQCQ